jgi:hypothetical protein
MATKHLTGTITLIKTGRKYETYALRFKTTTALRAAFWKNPETMMARFLRRKGFKVNSIRVLRPRHLKEAQPDAGVPETGRHIHSGPSASGWV